MFRDRLLLSSTAVLLLACTGPGPGGAPPATPPGGGESTMTVIVEGPAPGTTAAPAATAAPATPAADARFPVVAIHLLPGQGATGADAAMDFKLEADGSLHAQGKPVGKLAGNKVLKQDGAEAIVVAEDGAVSLGGSPTQVKVLATGDLVSPNGTTLRVGEDGTVSVVDAKGASKPAPIRIDGFKPEARGTAALLLLAAEVMRAAR